MLVLDGMVVASENEEAVVGSSEATGYEPDAFGCMPMGTEQVAPHLSHQVLCEFEVNSH
jgi:hypothetical protein